MAITLDGCLGEDVARSRLGLGSEYHVYRWDGRCADHAHFRDGGQHTDACMVEICFGMPLASDAPGKPATWHNRIGITLPYSAVSVKSMIKAAFMEVGNTLVEEMKS